MLRNQLAETLKNVSVKYGYNFYEGFEYRSLEQKLSFPLIWTTPPVLKQLNGRNEGMATYHISILLCKINQKWNETHKNNVWDAMELDAHNILNQIILLPGVFTTENIAMMPDENRLSKLNELSLKVDCDIRIYFPFEENPGASE